MEDRQKYMVYCYRCGKWLESWHYVYVGGKMLPACPDDRACKPERYISRRKGRPYGKKNS